MGCGSSKPPTPAEGALMRLITKVTADEEWKGEFPDFGKNIAKVAKKVASLDISGCHLDPVAGATMGACLPLFEILELLDVSNCGLKTIGISALSRAITKLEVGTITQFWLAGNYAESMGIPECTEAVCEALTSPGMAKCTSLNLSDNALGPSGAIKLAEALAKEKQDLAELLLADCQLGFTGGETLSKAISKLKSLRRVDLFNCMIGDKGAEGIEILLGETKAPLTFLSLQANAITYAGAITIAAGLKLGAVSDHLQAFDCSANALGNECNDGCDALADALNTNPPVKLETLNIAENTLGDGDPVGLLKAIGMAKSLTWLDLSANRLREAAGPAIATALETLGELKTLGLNDNEMLGDEGMVVVLESIEKNLPKLSELHAGKVNLDTAGAQAAIKVLSKVDTLTLMDLRMNRKLVAATCDEVRAAKGKADVLLPDDDKAELLPKPLDARKFTYQYVGAKAYVKKN